MRDRTCELCKFNIDDECRRFPCMDQIGGCVAYPKTYWYYHGRSGTDRRVYILSCAEYKEND